jgi:hypothetical protein
VTSSKPPQQFITIVAVGVKLYRNIVAVRFITLEYLLWDSPWKFYFDRSKLEQGAGIGVVLESPMGIKTHMALKLDQQCSHNQTEYEALIFELELLLEMKIFNIQIYGDSQLVVRQITREYKCGSTTLAPYLIAA